MERKKKESGEGGEEFALMKNGAWSEDGRRQGQKCHKTLRMHWMHLMRCQTVKKDSFARRGALLCLHAPQPPANQLPGRPPSWLCPALSAGAELEPQQVLL